MRTGQLSLCQLQNFTWVRGGAGGAGVETMQLLPPLHNIPSLCNPNLCSGRGECSLSTSLILYQAILSSSCQPYSLQKIPPLLLLSLQGAHIAPKQQKYRGICRKAQAGRAPGFLRVGREQLSRSPHPAGLRLQRSRSCRSCGDCGATAAARGCEKPPRLLHVAG